MISLVAVLFLGLRMVRIVSPNYVQLYTDKVVTFDATTTSQSESSLECALACQLNHPCVSYTYHPGRSRCHLYDRVIHHADATNAEDGIQTFTSEFGDENIALYKPTAQGSTFHSPSYQGVDGNNRSFFHTANSTWWCVDLLTGYEVKWLIMYNLFDIGTLHKNRIKGFEIWLAASGGCTQTGFDTSTLCYRDINRAALNIYTINSCSEPNTQFDARYVFIYHPLEVLHLYEVEIVPWCT